MMSDERRSYAEVTLKFRCPDEMQLERCWQDLQDVFGRLPGRSTVEVEVTLL